MKKIDVFEFDTVIYPPKLWIAVTPQRSVLNGRFRDIDGNDIEFEERKTTIASTSPTITDKVTGAHGVLITFNRKNVMTCSIIAHEAVHAAGEMFDFISEMVGNSEAFAYLVGWIAECCEKVKNGKANENSR